MANLLPFLPFVVVALLAQWSDRHRVVRWATYGLVLLFDAAVAIMGFFALALAVDGRLQRTVTSVLPGVSRADWASVGTILLGAAALAPVFLLPFVRRALSRIVPIAPDSGIHATALVLAIMALGLGIAQMPLVGGLDTLAASSIQVGVWDSMLSTLPIGLLALIGVGLFVRRTPRDTWKRLGLVRITWQQAGLAVGLALLIVGVSIAIDRAWRVLAPENYEMMDALSEVLYGQLARKWYHAVILSLLIGVSEEIFFRGALQPRFGYLPTAVVFAVAHAQYGLTPASVQILGAALLLGWLRQRTNTTTCIILHALFNALGLLLSPLLP